MTIVDQKLAAATAASLIIFFFFGILVGQNITKPDEKAPVILRANPTKTATTLIAIGKKPIGWITTDEFNTTRRNNQGFGEFFAALFPEAGRPPEDITYVWTEEKDRSEVIVCTFYIQEYEYRDNGERYHPGNYEKPDAAMKELKAYRTAALEERTNLLSHLDLSQ